MHAVTLCYSVITTRHCDNSRRCWAHRRRTRKQRSRTLWRCTWWTSRCTTASSSCTAQNAEKNKKISIASLKFYVLKHYTTAWHRRNLMNYFIQNNSSHLKFIIVYACMHIHKYTHTHTHVCMYTHTHAYAYACTHTHTHTHTHKEKTGRAMCEYFLNLFTVKQLGI